MNYVIIIAGGVGSRLGAPVPKQFVEVLGKPVVAYTMEHFQNHSEIDAIIFCNECKKIWISLSSSNNLSLTKINIP